MNENIDLTKILKDCPEGEKFWSKVHGEVTFRKINTADFKILYPIETEDCSTWTRDFTKDGRLSEQHQGECILVPSKDQQDWSKFSAPWLKKERFDPKTLHSYDRVLVKDGTWSVELFSHYNNSASYYPCICVGGIITRYCIPYNDDTKHLVGTEDEAPEYYKYWEK